MVIIKRKHCIHYKQQLLCAFIVDFDIFIILLGVPVLQDTLLPQRQQDKSHPSHHVFSQLPSNRHYSPSKDLPKIRPACWKNNFFSWRHSLTWTHNVIIYQDESTFYNLLTKTYNLAINMFNKHETLYHIDMLCLTLITSARLHIQDMMYNVYWYIFS